MKALLKKSVSSIHSFIVKEFHEPVFDPNWHFHPEYQLFCVLEGSGTRFIGDNIKHFGAGDMVFLGPNIPHFWRSDDYPNQHKEFRAHGLVIYFEEDFLGKEFFEKQEMLLIKQLFEKRGGDWRLKVPHMIQYLTECMCSCKKKALNGC
jgi:hypothetical protein